MIENYFKDGYEIKKRVTANIGGIAKEVFATTGNISGCMRPINGSEVYENDKFSYKATHRFYCKLIDIKADYLIKKNDDWFEVKAIINPMDMNKFLQVDCVLLENFSQKIIGIDEITMYEDEIILSEN